MKISLCMIVRNEETSLPKCLGSVKDFVDEIVVLDTGSTDKTTQIITPPNYGTKSYEKDPNSPKNKIYVQKTKPRIPDDQMYDPKNPLDVRKWKFQMGSPQPVGEPEPYGVSVQGGTTSLAPYGSVAPASFLLNCTILFAFSSKINSLNVFMPAITVLPGSIYQEVHLRLFLFHP